MSNSSNNLDDFGDLFTLPCMMSCCLAISAVVLVTRTSYIMGANAKDRGNQSYQTAFWTLCCALLSISMAYAIVKILE